MFRQDFSAQEWMTLQNVPIRVFTIVGGIDNQVDAKEQATFVTELSQAVLYKDPLVQEVLFSVTQELTSVLERCTQNISQTFNDLDQAADVLARKAPDHAEPFKQAMLLIGKKIAEASGGTLGLGSKVSKDEMKALVMVATALKIKMPGL